MFTNNEYFFIPESKLRKKWKYLRDQFSVELGKFPPDDHEYRPKWVHFDSLLFLKEMVKPRELIKKPKGKVSRRRRSATSAFFSDDTGAESSVNGDDDDGSSSDHDMSLLELLDQGATSSSKRKNFAEDNGNGSAKKMKSFNAVPHETDDDENLFFFKSLLPHVRKIPNNKILLFRNRIQQVVEEFAYRSEIEDVKIF